MAYISKIGLVKKTTGQVGRLTIWHMAYLTKTGHIKMFLVGGMV